MSSADAKARFKEMPPAQAGGIIRNERYFYYFSVRARRSESTSYRAIPVATAAFSDSTEEAIGIETI